MEISTVEQALLIILSAALAIAIILSIVISVLLIRVLNHIKRVVAKAEHAVQSAEAVGEIIKNIAVPASAMKAAKFMFSLVSRHFGNSQGRK